jgi:hypothetical protein
MSGAGRAGVVILSVDLELDIAHHRDGQDERLDEVRTWLVERMRDLQLPATWAVADPVLSAATDSIRLSGVGHEIAVLGDQTWIGYGTGKLRLERELTRRFEGARRTGIPVSTLALRNVDQLPDLDLLLAHGITAVRGPAVDEAAQARQLASPKARYGIWQAPAAWRIPPRRKWWIPSAWRIRHEIHQRVARGGMIHLEIDAPRLVDSDQDEIAVIQSVLQRIAARRNAGLLDVRTIGQIATGELQERSSTPSRSILRPAA